MVVVSNPSPSKQEVAMMLMEVGEVLRAEIKTLQKDFNEEKATNKEFRKGVTKVLSLLAEDREINNPVLDELKIFLNE